MKKITQKRMLMKLYNLFPTLLICSVNLLHTQQLPSTSENKKSIKDLTIKSTLNSGKIAVSINNAELESIADIYLLGSKQISFADCTQLNLKNNKLNEDLFEPLFNTFANLVKLDISHNNISNLPLIKSNLLEHFNISNNQLTELNLPNILSSLPQLRILNANHNSITQLYEDNLKFVSCLQDLQLTNNKIQKLNLTNLLNCSQKLTNLDLSHNPLSEVYSKYINLRSIEKAPLDHELYIPTINLQHTQLNTEARKELLATSLPLLRTKAFQLTLEYVFFGCVAEMVAGVFYMGISLRTHANDPALYTFVPVTLLYTLLFCIYAQKAQKYQKVYIPQFDQQNDVNTDDIEAQTLLLQ